ncbi:MAG: hypothetical protein H6Q51_1839 [Deltaproteobacteria bacterium]|nr:hypothetical protein [Deltaproteobacteria bacterium]
MKKLGRRSVLWSPLLIFRLQRCEAHGITGWIGITGNDWFAFLSQERGIDEMNFWRFRG